jgi:dTDP-4-amino-4,6-dideoxygalactose transaminase
LDAKDIIPHSRPSVDEVEINALRDVLASGQLAQGPQVQAFEEELGRRQGLPPGVAVSSGTAALHLALLSLGLGPGDEVLLPSYVCSAVLHSVFHAGARPVLVDVDPVTGNLDPGDLKQRLTAKSKAIIAVHLFGLPAAMDEIMASGLPVIEDCAQALGAKHEGRMVGGFGEIAVCSFYATKLMTTGEGGMLLSRDPALLDKARDLRDYDKRNRFAVRFNYKMTDFQAALGRSQLVKLETFLKQREALAHLYSEYLASLPCTLPSSLPGRVYYRYVISVQHEVQDLIQGLAQQGIEVARPVHRPLHHDLDLQGYPGAELAWNSHFSLPIHPSLLPQEVRRVCKALQLLIKRNSR